MAAADPPDLSIAQQSPEASGSQGTDSDAGLPQCVNTGGLEGSRSADAGAESTIAGDSSSQRIFDTQDGASASGDHSLTTHSTGQTPFPVQQSGSAGPVPATTTMATVITTAGKRHAVDAEERDKSTTVTVNASPSSKRRRGAKDASEGVHTASSTTERPSSPRSTRSAPKRPKTSFLARIARVCLPCISTSALEHDIDISEGPSRMGEGEKRTQRESEPGSQQSPTRESTTSATAVSPSEGLTIDLPGAPVETDIIIPPTPSKLLPVSETDGLTSGAVQPPGSTGYDFTIERTHTRESEEEDSDGSYSDSEALREILALDSEAEEQTLIRKGGNGIPIGPDGKPQPLLPPIASQHVGRKCLVLDLDETLVHSSLKPVPSPDYVVPVEIESFWHNFYVLKRPGVDVFLKKMGEIYEVVVFTASLSKYADPVLDRLDPDHAVAHRLFRESCFNHRGNYVKDLSQLGRPIADTIIIDNSPASYIFHPHNAVPVSSWFNDPHDTELSDLCPFLEDLGAAPGDVRGVLNLSI